MSLAGRGARGGMPAVILAALAWLTASRSLASDAPAQPAAGEISDAMFMAGLYGPYDMAREASGTSWQPDSTPIDGLMRMQGPWMGMIHGFLDAIYDDQGGPRGAVQSFSVSMLMLMARRQLDRGALGLRLMLSGDPLMGREGYPLIFQTGETANGVVPLIDRQHPHDLLMEAAVSYSLEVAPHSSLFVYAGLPGEPALGPTAFMHRASGMDDPEAPLSHHWLDSTHVAWGVFTLGYVIAATKLEASVFNGREPDQNHYDIQTAALDSWSIRASYNPTRNCSMQASTGHLVAPEQLAPQINVQRTTASATCNLALGLAWQTTLAFGRNDPSVGAASNAWLLESQWRVAAAHTVFARLERVGKDDLFLPGNALYGQVFTIEKLSLGYIYDFAQWNALRLGLGGLVSSYSFPAALNASYGYRPTSFMVFMRARL
jgi:hypothetical protein